MPDWSTREILENQFNGLTPIKRQNPRYGEKDYYYINPNRDRYSSLSDEDIAYVDSPDDPNPFLQQQTSTDTTGLTGTSSFRNTSSLTNDTLSLQNNVSTSTLSNNNVPKYWETSKEGEDIFNYVKQREGDIIPTSQNPISYIWSAMQAGNSIRNNNYRLKPQKLSDKYKHALINCDAAQYGSGGYDTARVISWAKEKSDIWRGRNTPDSSQADDYANQIGRLMGTKYPTDDCNTLIQKYIQK